MLRTQLLELAKIFQAATKATPATIGKRALNDNTVFARLEAAEIGFGVRTYDRLTQYFSDNWPDELDWPTHILRPERSAQSAERVA